jgi:amidase
VFRASVDRSEWYQALQILLADYEFLVLPTAQVFPFDATLDWPKAIGDRAMDTYHRWMEVVVGPSLAGLPTMNVPAGFGATGLPMGLQVIGRARADLSVLQVAHGYQQVTDYTAVRPALIR